jgi:hypothetical protein
MDISARGLKSLLSAVNGQEFTTYLKGETSRFVVGFTDNFTRDFDLLESQAEYFNR